MIDFDYAAPETWYSRIFGLQMRAQPHKVGGVVYVPEGSGTLTAEQVSKAVYAHSIHADCTDADWQAIADELNAELGSGTCRNQWQWTSGFCCSECFCTVPCVNKFANSPFAYCPNCGRTVVNEC